MSHMIRYSLLLAYFWTDISICMDPLIFQYDKFNGRTVLIRAKSEFDIQQIDFRTVTKDKYGTKIFSQWLNMVKPNGSPLGQFPWLKPDGICAEYELRSTLVDNQTVTQNLTIPPLELSSGSKIRTASIQNQPDNDIAVTVAYGTDMEYWAGSGARITSIEPYLKFVNCQTIYQQYPPPPQILNSGHLLLFSVQYAYSNCSFLYGLNITLDIPTEHCVQNFITNQSESLIINISCSSVPNLKCPIPKRDCAMDCSPLEIKTTVTNEDPRGRLPGKNTELLVVAWTYPNNTDTYTDHYQIRYSQANITDWNIVAAEKDSITVDEFKNKFLEIHPNDSINYTFQICAMLTSGCHYEIEWAKEKRYKIYYKKGSMEKVRDIVEISTMSSRHRGENSTSTGSNTKLNMNLISFSAVVILSVTVLQGKM